MSGEEYLPHNFLAEKTILSCLLIDSKTIEKVSTLISSETFYFQNHQILYKVLLTMSKKKLPIDVLTVATFLQERGLISKIGGIQVLIELTNQIPNLIYLEEYIWLIKEKSVRRSLIKLGYEIIHSGYVTNISLENFFTDLEIKLFELNNLISKSTLFSSGQILNNVFFELKEKFLNPSLPGISSGFNDLDSLIQGFQKSDLIVVAGRPSMGKTAFSINLALNVLRQSRLPVLFFSLEMSKEQIMYRILSMEANISQSRLKSGQLYQNDWIKLNKLMKIISKLPIFIDDSINLSVENIRSKIKTVFLEQQNLGLVVIDYLQLMTSSKIRNENRVEELAKITRQLKSLAREFDIPIIALSQLSRNVENRIDKKPILSDLRESGSIEQDADLVIMLSKITSMNPSKNVEDIDFIVAKHRNGPIGTISLRFDKIRTQFLN